MNEKTFLANYDPKAFDIPIVGVDAVLFTYHEKCLKVLLVQRANHPDKGKWGLPGGFVDLGRDKSLEDTVVRKLKEKTGVVPPYIEQLITVGNKKRDKRGWSIAVCYTALLAHQQCSINIDDVADVQWVDMAEIGQVALAFDHLELIREARERLKQKALYSIEPVYALPKSFTLSALQHLHEVIIGKSIQKKSFRRRLEQADLLIDTGEKHTVLGRPASLYTVKPSAKGHKFVRNLEA